MATTRTNRIVLTEHSGFTVNQRVYTKQPTRGATFVELDDEDEREDEITYPAGTPAIITAIEDFGSRLGIGFTIAIGEISNTFDGGDGPITDFISTTAPGTSAKVGVTFEINGHGDGEEFPDLKSAGERIGEWVTNLDPTTLTGIDVRVGIEILDKDS